MNNANTDTPRSEDDEDAFNDWNLDIDNYVPTLWDAYLFGLSRGRSERDSARYKSLAEQLAVDLKELIECCEINHNACCRDGETDAYCTNPTNHMIEALTEARAAGLLKETM